MKPQIAIALLAFALLSNFAFANTNVNTPTDVISEMYADLRLPVETSNLSRYSKYLHADASLRPPGRDGINGKKKLPFLDGDGFCQRKSPDHNKEKSCSDHAGRYCIGGIRLRNSKIYD